MNKIRLMATRYDNKTLEQLSMFREKNPDEFGQDKAIYCAPISIHLDFFRLRPASYGILSVGAVQ